MDTKLSVSEITDLKILNPETYWDAINVNCLPDAIRNDTSIIQKNTNKLMNTYQATSYQVNEEPTSIEIATDEPESIADVENYAADMPTEDSPNSLDSIKLDTPIKQIDIRNLLSVSVAESVTAGALSNALCSEPGSSKFFLGGVVAYNMETQKNVLGVDAEYAERNNFANPFTTYIMAKNVTNMFQSRIGISTTGFSLPLYREANLLQGKCEIDVKVPYAYICSYDALYDTHRIIKVTNDNYSPSGNQRVQRAKMQVKIALQCKKIFVDYCESQRAKCNNI
jgi:nicotinamide mononucleotide (NMN) deamidase PncC